MKNVVKLANGLPMPLLGFGTWQLVGDQCLAVVQTALKVGYRHLDTADRYGNHEEVGKALKGSGVARKEVFLTTKVARDLLHRDEVLVSAERFLKELDTDYLDLLLIHWPNQEIAIKETLGAFRKLYEQKIIKAIDVSNFTIPLLQEALAVGVQITVNQVEFHPSLYQKKLHEFCQKNGIVVTAYSPIAQGEDLKIPLIGQLAKKYERSPAQIILNWIMKKGIAAIPRSSKPQNIKDNFGALSFELSGQDSLKIDKLRLHMRLINRRHSPFED